jgi:putative Holliday junction resolvase
MTRSTPRRRNSNASSRDPLRVLALDYGSARCGVAVCDPTETVVTPLAPQLRAGTRAGIGALAALVAERQVERVIVGLPLSLNGSDSAQTAEAREFAQRLQRRLGPGVPIEFHDERLTTRLAQRDPSQRASEDSRAAAHLLEDWLARGKGAGTRARLPAAEA